MFKPSSWLRILSLLLAAALLLPACNPAAALPTVTSTPLPPTATVTATPTLTPTPLPPTATSTPTRTPRPTPKPEGFYDFSNIGMSFQAPATWMWVQGDTNYIALMEPSRALVMLAMGGPALKEQTAQELIDGWAQDFGEDHPMRLISQEKVVIGEDIPALQLEIGVTYPDGEQYWRMYYIYHSGRSYQFTFMGKQDAMETRLRTLNDLLASVRLYPPRPFDLPRDETLLLLGGDPEAGYLDPAVTTSSASDLVGLLFSGLVRLTDNLQVEPDLAERWEISPDGLTYTFTLREGLTFASGKDLEASDVKASWERAAATKTGSTTAATYLGDIAGVKQKLAGEAKDISGVQVIDRRTLRVTLDAPKPYFLAKLTYPTAFVIKATDAEYNPNKWMMDPDSSGPYTIKEYVPGEFLVLERNKRYYAPASIRYVVFNLAPGGSPISLYEEGSIDMLSLDDELLRRVQVETDPLHAEWLSAPSLCTSLVQIDPSKPPMDDINVRRALAQAIDPQELLKKLDASSNMIAQTIFPPAMPGFTDRNASLPFDPQAAKEALAASKYADNLPAITITAGGYGQTERKDLTALVEMWKKNLGIQVRVEYVDPLKLTEAARKNHGQMVMYGWCADYPDPENFLDLLYHSGSDFNVATYSNAEVDRLLESARIEPDPAVRLAAYQEVEALLLEDVATIPLFHSMMDMLVKPRVKGFALSPAHNNFIAHLSLDPSQDR